MKLASKISFGCSLVVLVLAALCLCGCEVHDDWSSLNGSEVSRSISTKSMRSTKSWTHPIVQYATTAIVPISLGNQTVDLMPDTGSFDMLVSSVLCEQCGGSQYQATQSPDFHLDTPVKSKTFHFGSGDLEAIHAFDRFEAGPFDVKQMPMWLIRKLSPELYDAFDSSEMQGVLGLGLLRSTAAQEMGIHHFSLCLHTFHANSFWNGGVVHWNGREESLDWSQPLSTIGDDFHWQLGLLDHGVHLGQAKVCGSKCSLIVDSGTSILAVPHQVASIVEQALPHISEGCDVDGLPDFTLYLAHGVTLTLPPSSYVMKFTDVHDMRKFSALADAGLIIWRRPTGRTLCAPVLQVTNSKSWVLGMPLFRAYAVHFDRLAKTISFGRNEGGTCKQDSSTALMLEPQKRKHTELEGPLEMSATAFIASLHRRQSHRSGRQMLATAKERARQEHSHGGKSAPKKAASLRVPRE